MKSNFEERLEALCGADGLKGAKQLLKQNLLCGAWHDEAGHIHGVFKEDSGRVHCRVEPGEKAVSECSKCRDLQNFNCCSHGVALMMYSGRFHRPEISDPETQYHSGLRRAPLPSLINIAGRGNSAELFIDCLHLPPHVPTKWENTVFKCKIRCNGREYLGNLTNLRQLYFEKFLSATVRWENFSPQDKQLIHFLALNGEAENSNVLLPAEMAAELLHSLVGFDRFVRDNRPVIVRRETGEPVLLVNGNKCFPGIRLPGAVVPVRNAKIIAGRTGCWVGVEGEYFFVPAKCEIGPLRSFFASPAREEKLKILRSTRMNFHFPC